MQYQTSYTITEDLIEASVRQTYFKVYLGKKWLIILCFFVFAILGIVFSKGSLDYAVSGGVLGLALLVSIMWIKSYFVNMNNAKSVFKMSGEGDMDLKIDGNNLTITSNAGSRLVKLDKVTGVIETRDFLVLMVDKQPVFTPKVDFLSEEIKQFLLDLNR